MLTVVRVLLIGAELYSAWCLWRVIREGRRLAREGGSRLYHLMEVGQLLFSIVFIAAVVFVFAKMHGLEEPGVVLRIHDALVVCFCILLVSTLLLNGKRSRWHRWLAYSLPVPYVGLMMTGTYFAFT